MILVSFKMWLTRVLDPNCSRSSNTKDYAEKSRVSSLSAPCALLHNSNRLVSPSIERPSSADTFVVASSVCSCGSDARWCAAVCERLVGASALTDVAVRL
jgi:hypothetical protein